MRLLCEIHIIPRSDDDDDDGSVFCSVFPNFFEDKQKFQLHWKKKKDSLKHISTRSRSSKFEFWWRSDDLPNWEEEKFSFTFPPQMNLNASVPNRCSLPSQLPGNKRQNVRQVFGTEWGGGAAQPPQGSGGASGLRKEGKMREMKRSRQELALLCVFPLSARALLTMMSCSCTKWFTSASWTTLLKVSRFLKKVFTRIHDFNARAFVCVGRFLFIDLSIDWLIDWGAGSLRNSVFKMKAAPTETLRRC